MLMHEKTYVIPIFMLSAQLRMEFNLLIEINCWKIKTFHPPKLSDVVFVMFINVKVPAIVGIYDKFYA